jgi:hypothetical protein
MHVLLLLILLATALAIAPRDAAADDTKPLNLQLKSKALLASGASENAPFVAPSGDGGRALDLSPAPQRHSSRSACGIDSSWCYDMSEGGGRTLVYKPARNYMPHFDGLRAENISVKRDRIVFRYSFR